jgi:hypothetical protein
MGRAPRHPFARKTEKERERERERERELEIAEKKAAPVTMEQRKSEWF